MIKLRLRDIARLRVTIAKATVGTTHVLELLKLANYSALKPYLTVAPDCREARTTPPAMLSSMAH